MTQNNEHWLVRGAGNDQAQRNKALLVLLVVFIIVLAAYLLLSSSTHTSTGTGQGTSSTHTSTGTSQGTSTGTGIGTGTGTGVGTATTLPANFAIASTTYNSITVTWTPHTGYTFVVYWMLVGSGNQQSTVGLAGPTYSIPNVMASQLYDITIAPTLISTGAVGNQLPTLNVSVPAPPAATSTSAATFTNAQLVGRWTDSRSGGVETVTITNSACNSDQNGLSVYMTGATSVCQSANVCTTSPSGGCVNAGAWQDINHINWSNPFLTYSWTRTPLQ
jgi:hypothetical protein